MVMNDLRAGDQTLYRSTARAVGILLGANVVGAGLACAFFYVLATNALSLLKSWDPTELGRAVGQRIGWTDVAAVSAAAAVGACWVAAWAHRRATA
jgi:hypothetical protein